MMSDEGGLEEVEESLRAAASCSCRRATVACNCSSSTRCCSTCACKRWQPAQGLAAPSAMPSFYSRSSRSTISVNGHQFARIVIGYHACIEEFARDLLLGTKPIREWTPSTNDWDWLGHGIYFWEHSLERALRWGREALSSKVIPSTPTRASRTKRTSRSRCA